MRGQSVGSVKYLQPLLHGFSLMKNSYFTVKTFFYLGVQAANYWTTLESDLKRFETLQ